MSLEQPEVLIQHLSQVEHITILERNRDQLASISSISHFNGLLFSMLSEFAFIPLSLKAMWAITEAMIEQGIEAETTFNHEMEVELVEGNIHLDTLGGSKHLRYCSIIAAHFG